MTFISAAKLHPIRSAFTPPKIRLSRIPSATLAACLVLVIAGGCRLVVGTAAVAVGTVGLVGYGVYSVGESAVSAVGSVVSSGASESSSQAYASGDFFVTRDTTVDELWSAAVRSLKTQGFAIETGERDSLSGYLKAQTQGGDAITLHIEALSREQSRLRMRVGERGDLRKSEILFDQIDQELTSTPRVVGALTPSIHVLHDTNSPLPTAGTYGWGLSLLRVDPALRVKLSDVEARMHQALEAALPAEGFRPAEQDPDYLIGFAFLSGQSLDEAELNAAYGKLLNFPGRESSAPGLRYEQGVLILDIIDRAKGRLLWRGAIKADIDLALPENKKQQRCDEAIRELLRHYPPIR